jgi:hypothetical protein
MAALKGNTLSYLALVLVLATFGIASIRISTTGNHRVLAKYRVDAEGGHHGEISGMVRDHKSGKPLVGVPVSLKGTTLGALTSMKGSFCIKRVPPGVYELEANLVGYKRVSASNVTVEPDKGISFGISMDETGEAICIMPTRRAVHPDFLETEFCFSRIPERHQSADFGKITVRAVRDLNGSGLTVFSVVAHGPPRVGLSDSSGVFQSGHLAPGLYSLSVTLATLNYINVDSIEVCSGEITEITLRLKDGYWR